MGKDARCVVPAEVEGVKKLSVSAEVHHVSLQEVVHGVSAKKDAAVRRDGRTCGRIIQHAARRRFIGCGIDTEMRACPASTLDVGATGVADGEAHSAAVIQPI